MGKTAKIIGRLIDNQLIKGIGFGITSAIITTLGLMIGLYSSTRSTQVVMAGVVVIAIADALSDALGMHISEEAEGVHSTIEVWEATFSTFFAKFFFAMTFAIPLLLFDLGTAILVSLVWGTFLICSFSYVISRNGKDNPLTVVAEHLVIAILVVIITFYVGEIVASLGPAT